ncbi:poly(3-hydroxyalkanoate) depolymerase [Actinomycetospora straminea]|uniref:Poly(3-hydroxyalkanoate) depolymerase n=1 Tax=Actinomycetospora straminea TaxID=663607 RepID=A0ABP9ETB6_9PSEU|nr:poly(3-hydroxyalkanoate) depolymerase [Actinomycetospora straminea]MDD7931461.1 poly(3-hydroxyalkanoate) depolymerase [Actinomycetospora straminea]
MTAVHGPRQVHGVTLNVDVQPGEGVPLLLCNGIGANVELLQPLVDDLHVQGGRRMPVIRFDMPGTGGSPTTRLPRRMHRWARMVADLVTDLGYDEVDVLGISWGGALAQEFAHRHPRLCRRLVLCATSMGMVMVPARPSVLLTLASPLRYFGPSHLRETGRRIYGGGFGSDPTLAARFATHTRAPDPLGYYWQIAAGVGWTSAHYLPHLPQRVLLLAGDDDPIIPTVNAHLMARLLRHGRLHVVRGGGHLALLTHAAEVVPLVHDFLTDGETTS